MQISHTVYRNRNNAVVLQLLSDDEPLENPLVIDDVEVSFVDSLVMESESEFISYDGEQGTVTMILGRIPEILALEDGNYEVEVTGYGSANAEGVAFGSFMIFLRDWGGEDVS